MLLKGLEEVGFAVFKSMKDETVVKTFITNNAIGGPTQFEIQNTSPTVQQVYAGDGLFRVSGKGNGQITATFAAQDIPADALHTVLGYEQDKNSGLWVAGKNTRLVYGAIYAKSHTLDDEEIWIGLTKGTFTRGAINPQTNQAQETDATDSLTITAVNRASDGVAYFEGSTADGLTTDKVRKYAFPGYTGTYVESPVAPTTVVTPKSGE